MTRNWKRNLIGGLSFTTMLFVFQACYGTPQDIGYDTLVEGKVISKTSGLPIKGIKVFPLPGTQHQFTGDDGKFSFYCNTPGDVMLRFEDADSVQNGNYLTKDTLLTNLADSIYIDVALEDK